VNTAVTYEQTKPFAKAIARLLEERHPDLVVSDMKKALRVNKVFVDWSQNDDYKTTVNVYSLRAKDQPTVSTPVSWKEVENCLQKGGPELLVFTSDQVLERVEKSGDLFEPVLKLKQKLPPLTALGQGVSQPTASAPAAKVKKIQSARPARKAIAKSVSKPVKRKARAR
jgi:bifunctional non-homologous end joining protein LigD